MVASNDLFKEISVEFAKGNLAYSQMYFAEDVQWNILGNETIRGKQEIIEVSKMQQLQSFPVITIKNIVGEGELVVVESTGEAKTRSGKPYNQTYCEVFRFNNGRLQEITTYLDTALSKEALADS
jgi:uncharacterized protein